MYLLYLTIIVALITIIIIIVNYCLNKTESKTENDHYKYLYSIIENKSGSVDLQTKIYYPNFKQKYF
jgi:hypothetical protein